ncbi:ABC transporter ATP-binding protein [Sulfolobus sp. A20]|uniref:ABC transporter ATP-binding protein n=1 Tax=Sulfolobaceae TaxID=118883 RepID=UPI000845F7F0|nr:MULTISPECIES: ABC transporter ATP-binding protein [unclassified Sulfolobus]TRM73795.1 ABC transporter ATP-binding protein [Sulfolobus sp. E5]TRM74784.1 ABC transporter ATP-binding protein [Sulfolobus sp. A20-N-F8]TRM79175.1 ABC transporter ATP-binding protein [Sulfolobus sp. B5]TRM80662.1 ABC transporter ATP-binding protein [Sulfolobus sp. A20-N-F6]TRM81765.1 ABC transporter ATP-binding protein [Sulfolobus sp. D5]TRM81905.1 ABC transporter ATP-binding protein [Sulfolobus sp. F3]TRM94872.1
MNNEEIIVDAVDLSKVYKTKKAEYVALRGVSLKVRKGEFLIIAGPSGSGKTTLLDLIGLLDTPSSGKIIINNIDVTNFNEDQRANFRKKYIGFVFQSYNLITYLSVLENVELALASLGIPAWKRREKAEEILSLIPGMLELKNKKPNELSGGQQQRVAIARALANDPKILIADEPTANLDSKTGLAIVELISKLNKEKNVTVIMATHDPDMMRYADRIVYIRDGQIEKEVVQNE